MNPDKIVPLTRFIQARMAEHAALYWKLEHGESIDDQREVRRLGFLQYLKVTGRLSEPRS